MRLAHMGACTILMFALLACSAVVQGAVFTFKGGSLGVRPGCPLDVLGKVELIHEKHEAPCGDKEDQDDFTKAVDMWKTAANTWVDTCTAKGTQKMDKGCPVKPAELTDGKPYESAANTWFQFYNAVGKKPVTHTGIDKGAWKTSLLDIRKGKLVLAKSKLQFFNAFLYMSSGGVLRGEETHIYAEDNADSEMGAAIIGVDGAKVGLLPGSEFVQQDAVFAWRDGKIWLVGSLFKQIGGATVIQNTAVMAEKSSIQFWKCQQAHIARSVVNLTSTDITLEGSYLHIWDSTLILSAETKINLNGGSRLLLSNVKVVGDGFVTATKDIPGNYGINPGGQLDAMNIDFKLGEAEGGEITFGAQEAKPAATKP